MDTYCTVGIHKVHRYSWYWYWLVSRSTSTQVGLMAHLSHFFFFSCVRMAPCSCFPHCPDYFLILEIQFSSAASHVQMNSNSTVLDCSCEGGLCSLAEFILCELEGHANETLNNENWFM